METDHAYPPAEWSADDIEATLRNQPVSYPLPRYADESAWRTIRKREQTRPLVDTAREKAAAVDTEPVVPLTASGYLNYAREGTRDGYSMKTRSRNLGALVVAECVDREGEYLDSILDYVWAMCEQSTWTRPAHLPGSEEYRSGLPRPVAPAQHHIALQTAISAKFLAEARYVLGDQLHPAARERIATEIDERVLTPFLERDDFSWQSPPTANHNAVCNGSTLVAALHAEPAADRTAALVRKAARNMRHYLSEFGVDGATSEGIGYWKFGLSFYTMAAKHLEERTGGEFSLFSPPIVAEIATFPLRIELSPNRYPAFSDGSEREDITPYLACALGERFDLPALCARGWAALSDRDSVGYFSSILRNLAWCSEPPTEYSPALPRRAYFRGHEWWLARVEADDPDALVVAAKGGHNDEAHNHNDCGSFVVHYNRESLLTDPGPGEYVEGYFGEDRYEFFANRSLSHSVPYVNGYEQAAGAAHAAEVLDRRSSPDRERLRLDLASCYPQAAGLERLEREFDLDRTAKAAGRLDVVDTARFAGTAPGRELTSVLIADVPVRVEGEGLLVEGERGRAKVTPTTPVSMSVERLEDAFDGRVVWRAKLTPETVDPDPEVGLSVEPTSGRSCRS